MNDRADTSDVSRRDVIRSSAGALVAASAVRAQTSRPADAGAALPMNPLGKTGVKVTRLGMGASFPDYGPRLLDFAFRCGIRYFDNGDGYARGKAEAALGKWAVASGKRDEVFLVTKSHAYTPDAFYEAVGESLERMALPTIDLYMVHALEDPEIPLDQGGEWKRVKDRLVREKKIRFMGFSTHVEMSARSACLRNAVKGGWVDALMVACDPGLIRANAEFNEAIGACAEAGVGLVCMKTTRGLGRGEEQPEKAREAFAKLGLTPHQAMQAGMWSDGRFASVCSEMMNRRIMEENAAGARKFTKPFDEEQQRILEEGMRGLARATCPGCDGSCRRAAGTATDFCSIARCVDYYEHDGNRETARRLYAELRPEQRDARGADLGAASAACPAHLDFAAILRKAERHLA